MSVIYKGNLTVDLDKVTVKVNDNKVYLTVIEYKIIEALVTHDFIKWDVIDYILKEEQEIKYPKKWVFSSTNPFEVPEVIIDINNKLKFCSSNINLKLSEDGVKLGSYIPKYQSSCIISTSEFDESSKEIQEKEELIDELRYQIRRDMEDYKLLCSDKYGNEDIPLFGDEEHYRFLRIYLRDNIKNNIQKLRDINKC